MTNVTVPWSGTVPLPVWEAALRASGAGVPVERPPGASAQEWATLVDAGVAVAAGKLADVWRDLLDAQRQAEIQFRLVSTFDGFTYVADVTVGDPNTAVVVVCPVTKASDGALECVEGDGEVRVQASSGHPWILLQQALPPLDILRAGPRQTRAGEVIPVRLDETTRRETLAVLTGHEGMTMADALRRQPSLPEGVREVLATRASVLFFAQVRPRGATSASSFGVGAYVAGEHLFRMTGKDGTPQWERVEPGDLGFSLLTLLMRATDALGRARRTREQAP